MMELTYCPTGIYIYNVNDWITLRQKYRIIGEIIGSNNNIPALPVKLLPEEVGLLIEKNLVKIVSNTSIKTDEKDEYKKFENDLYKQQEILYRNNRKRQLEGMIDTIVAAKRKFGSNESVEEIFNKELEKSSKISTKSMIWPILPRPLNSAGNTEQIDINLITNKINRLKQKVFNDLWEKGYYITQGHKFGGDFLVYLGDPIIYHAVFIVRCVEDPTREINPTELIGFGRLGTCVKKRTVLASFNKDDTISYITINWMDA